MGTKRSVKKMKVVRDKAKTYIGKNQLPVELLSELSRVMEKKSSQLIEERLKQIF